MADVLRLKFQICGARYLLGMGTALIVYDDPSDNMF